MTTPYGLLRWGQAGRYTALDDRLVITALAGGRSGVVRPVRMVPSTGLAITLDAGWLAVADCADGTCAVLSSVNAIEVRVAPGGETDRQDEVLAEVIDPETAQWAVSVLPPGAGTEGSGGIVLGWVTVPAGAASATEMTLDPRGQDFSTGGAIPGPPGPRGPEGPGGPAGQATLIVGSFGTVRTPAELPPDGFIEAGWDGPGNPANDAQMQTGWALIYTVTGELWVFVGPEFATPWLNVGLVAGAEGPPGPEGPRGPQGPPGQGGTGGGGITDQGQWVNTTAEHDLVAHLVPANDAIPGTIYQVLVSGLYNVGTTANIRLTFRLYWGAAVIASDAFDLNATAANGKRFRFDTAINIITGDLMYSSSKLDLATANATNTPISTYLYGPNGTSSFNPAADAIVRVTAQLSQAVAVNNGFFRLVGAAWRSGDTGGYRTGVEEDPVQPMPARTRRKR